MYKNRGEIPYMDKKEEQLFHSEEHVPLFGYHLIRNVLLHELLGKEHDSILYWTGKSIARSYPLMTKEEIIEFFYQAGWGDLSIKKEGKDEVLFHLTPSFHKKQLTISYQLESGFLAEQIQKQTGFISEAILTEKKDHIIFSVKFDRKDAV